MEVLYIYDHCPFCVKPRMIFGFKNRPYTITYLLNDDEETPIKMIGQKMLPILQEGDHYMAESMDIVAHVDQLDGKPVLTGASNPVVIAWIDSVYDNFNRLVIPRYANNPTLPEFVTAEARAYFTRKKEVLLGDFSTLFAQTEERVAEMNKKLLELDPLIKSASACNGELSEDDIHLFPILRGLSMVEGVIYPEKVNNYRQTMSALTGVPLFTIS